ncbi:EpsL, exopolysaccharide biosynthesis operon protein EpsL [Methylophilaceae bacterium]
MLQLTLKTIPACCLLFCAGFVQAEGIIDLKPFVGANITYDDNVFRFSSPEQAQQAFGSPATSDTIKRLDVGLDATVRLSRQQLRLSTSLSKSSYNRFDLLDNTAKSNLLAWDWRLGNDIFGVLTTSKNESIAGFSEIRNPIKNMRTVERQAVSLNWRFHPDWTAYLSRDQFKTENQLEIYEALNRDDKISEAGVRYSNPLGTQLALSYRLLDSKFPNRTGSATVLFGDESVQSLLTLELAWLPTLKTRIRTKLSRVKIDYEDTPQREFSDFNQRFEIGHALTSKVTLNASVYKEVFPIDDILSTYVEATGLSFNPSWAISNKVILRGGMSYEDRDYLGSSGIVNNELLTTADDRADSSKTANLTLAYEPTLKSLIQMQYQTEKRKSTLNNQNFDFNSISFTARFNF